MINFNETYKSKLELKYLEEVTNGNYINNYFRKKSEEILIEKFKFDNILLTHSATAALEIAGMVLAKNKSISKIHLPSYTFSSTANAFIRAGININFTDINIDNLMIDFSKLKISKNDHVCIVHYAGSSVDFEKLETIENFNFNKLIEDAAQGLGTKFNNKQVGTFGRFGCISFHPTKSIHSGFGGLLNIKNKEDLEMATYIYERGTDRSKVISGQKNKYEWVELGSSFEMTELSAAVLLSQLEEYDKISELRKEIYKTYLLLLKTFLIENNIKFQIFDNRIQHNYHAFYLILNENSNAFLNYLNKNGIQAYIGYVPLHSSAYGIRNKLNKKLINTEKIANTIIRLPLHTQLKYKDVKKISSCVKNYNFENKN